MSREDSIFFQHMVFYLKIIPSARTTKSYTLFRPRESPASLPWNGPEAGLLSIIVL